MTDDVLPWEQMKLRMLNGSHSFLAWLGYLAGHAHISDCMRDDVFRRAARQLMLDEQAPTLTITGVDLLAYADSLIARFSNPALKHRTWQIAMDGSQKLPQRMLDGIRVHLARDSRWPLLALGVAKLDALRQRHGRRRSDDRRARSAGRQDPAAGGPER